MKRAPGTRDWAARSEGSRAGMGGAASGGPSKAAQERRGPPRSPGPAPRPALWSTNEDASVLETKARANCNPTRDTRGQRRAAAHRRACSGAELGPGRGRGGGRGGGRGRGGRRALQRPWPGSRASCSAPRISLWSSRLRRSSGLDRKEQGVQRPRSRCRSPAGVQLVGDEEEQAGSGAERLPPDRQGRRRVGPVAPHKPPPPPPGPPASPEAPRGGPGTPGWRRSQLLPEKSSQLTVLLSVSSLRGVG